MTSADGRFVETPPSHATDAAVARVGTSRRVGWPLLATLVLIWLAGVAYLAGALPNHDASWFLISTRSWLFDGARLYVDVVELNPPLAFYVTAPAVLAGQAFGIPDAIAFNLYLATLAGASIALALWTAAKAPGASPALLGAYSTLALIVSLAPAMSNAGEREHFLVLFALPYVTMAAFRPLGCVPSRSVRVALAALACIGLFVKPHYLLAPLAISLTRCWRERSWRPLFSAENWTIGTLAVGYVAFVAVAHPAYFSEVVPLTVLTYWAYGLPLLAILPYQVLFVVLLAAFLLTVRQEAAAHQRTAEILIATTLAFLAAYIAQNKGFSYHRIPADAFGALATVTVIFALLTGRGAVRAAALSCAAAVVAIGTLFVASGRYQNEYYEHLRDELGPDMRGKSILGFSVFIEPFFPYAAVSGARWASRYPCLWPMRAAAQMAASPDGAVQNEGRAVLETLRREVAADLSSHRPDYVISERKYAPEGMDYIGFFSGDAAFSREWRHYRLVKAFSIFEVWQRDPPPA